MTIFDAYNLTKQNLEKAGIEDYVFEAKQIIKHVTGMTNVEILNRYTNVLTKYQSDNLNAIIEKRIARYPLQYIFGNWDFYGLNFKVGSGVLCPRADTEVLVETGKELVRGINNPKILDLCSGSGCVGITLAKEIDGANVICLEKYEEALNYLKQNIELNKADNATAFCGDIFNCDKAEEKFDLIVSNPPYVSASEMCEISPEAEYEPQTALYGGEDGLMFYRAITDNYKNSLNKGGALAFEIGFSQAKAVSEILAANGFKNITVKKDIEDRERVVFGTLN